MTTMVRATIAACPAWMRKQLRSPLTLMNITGLSDPYVEVNFVGDSSSRKTVVRKKTLNPRWGQPLLLEVRSDRAVGELTKKGAKKGCFWFQFGNRLALQVRQTPRSLLQSDVSRQC